MFRDFSLSRKPDFSPTASVGASAVSEARKEEPGVLPPGPLFSQLAPKLTFFLIFGRILAALKLTKKRVPPKASQNQKTKVLWRPRLRFSMILHDLLDSIFHQISWSSGTS